MDPKDSPGTGKPPLFKDEGYEEEIMDMIHSMDSSKLTIGKSTNNPAEFVFMDVIVPWHMVPPDMIDKVRNHLVIRDSQMPNKPAGKPVGRTDTKLNEQPTSRSLHFNDLGEEPIYDDEILPRPTSPKLPPKKDSDLDDDDDNRVVDPFKLPPASKKESDVSSVNGFEIEGDDNSDIMVTVPALGSVLPFPPENDPDYIPPPGLMLTPAPAPLRSNSQTLSPLDADRVTPINRHPRNGVWSAGRDDDETDDSPTTGSRWPMDSSNGGKQAVSPDAPTPTPMRPLAPSMPAPSKPKESAMSQTVQPVQTNPKKRGALAVVSVVVVLMILVAVGVGVVTKVMNQPTVADSDPVLVKAVPDKTPAPQDPVSTPLTEPVVTAPVITSVNDTDQPNASTAQVTAMPATEVADVDPAPEPVTASADSAPTFAVESDYTTNDGLTCVLGTVFGVDATEAQEEHVGICGSRLEVERQGETGLGIKGISPQMMLDGFRAHQPGLVEHFQVSPGVTLYCRTSTGHQDGQVACQRK